MSFSGESDAGALIDGLRDRWQQAAAQVRAACAPRAERVQTVLDGKLPGWVDDAVQDWLREALARHEEVLAAAETTADADALPPAWLEAGGSTPVPAAAGMVDPGQDTGTLIGQLFGRPGAAQTVPALLAALPKLDDRNRAQAWAVFTALERFADSLEATRPEAAPEWELADRISAARKQLEVLLRLVLTGGRPAVLALAGPSGSGKQDLGQRLARSTGLRLHDLATVRRSLSQGTPTEHDPAFSLELTRRSHEALIRIAADDALRHGLAFTAGTMLTPAGREGLRDLCRERGVRLVWVALDPDPGALRDRIEAELPEGQARVDRLESLDAQLAQWQVPGAGEGDEVVLIKAGTRPAEAGAAIVRAGLIRAGDDH